MANEWKCRPDNRATAIPNKVWDCTDSVWMWPHLWLFNHNPLNIVTFGYLVSSHCKSDVFIVVFPLSSIKVARLETWHHGIK